MPLVSIDRLMDSAIEGAYAVGYFESWNFESLQGVIDAAEHTQSPIIIGFNGEFISSPKRAALERIEWYGALGRVAAESASVPCGFIFNECPQDSWVRRAVMAGFNLVMPVPGQDEQVGDYAVRTSAIVRFAHAHAVAVEAELGAIPVALTKSTASCGSVSCPELSVPTGNAPSSASTATAYSTSNEFRCCERRSVCRWCFMGEQE